MKEEKYNKESVSAWIDAYKSSCIRDELYPLALLCVNPKTPGYSTYSAFTQKEVERAFYDMLNPESERSSEEIKHRVE